PPQRHGRERHEREETDQHASLDRRRGHSADSPSSAGSGAVDRVHQRRRTGGNYAQKHQVAKENPDRQSATKTVGVGRAGRVDRRWSIGECRWAIGAYRPWTFAHGLLTDPLIFFLSLVAFAFDRI